MKEEGNISSHKGKSPYFKFTWIKFIQSGKSEVVGKKLSLRVPQQGAVDR